MAELPPRINFEERKIRVYKFSELLNEQSENLKSNYYGSIVFIDDPELLKSNIDFLKLLIGFGYTNVYSMGYDSLKFIEENINKSLNLYLLDDFENKDRSYIDLSFFEKSTIQIPLAYSLWFEPNANLNTTQSMSMENLWPSSEVGTSKINLEDLKRIREEIFKLSEKCKNLDEVEKAIIVSDYLQNRVQFVNHDNRSQAGDGLYITSGKLISSEDTGNIANVLFEKFGVCKGIASTSTILLNNPQMDVNIRNARGGDHVWNVIKVGNEYYYIDNTWNITRNPNRYEESLKAKHFSSKYLLFGDKTARKIGHHDAECVIPRIQEDDYSRHALNKKVKKLEYIAKYTNYDKPRFKSYKKEDI